MCNDWCFQCECLLFSSVCGIFPKGPYSLCLTLTFAPICTKQCLFICAYIWWWWCRCKVCRIILCVQASLFVWAAQSASMFFTRNNVCFSCCHTSQPLPASCLFLNSFSFLALCSSLIIQRPSLPFLVCKKQCAACPTFIRSCSVLAQP